MDSQIVTGLSFDDVLLVPGYSEVLPAETCLYSRLAEGFPVNIPVLSAAMDTVTESRLAIALAREGGVGVIHRNCTIEEQCGFVREVKRSENTVVDEPVTVNPETTIGQIKQIITEKRVSGIPVVDADRRLVGIVTRRDIRYSKNDADKVTEVMTPRERIVTGYPGTSLEEAKEILYKNRIEKLPLVSEDNVLEGLMTGKDIEKSERYKSACKDEKGRLRVGAAVGTGPDCSDRAAALIESGVDALFIDAATGHTRRVIETVENLVTRFPKIPVIAGNVVTAQGAQDLVTAGAKGIKVGVGPGSICTTRVVSGVGLPQFSAIREVAPVCRKSGVTVIADGGIRYSGDILKALAAGADLVMAGSLLAGTEESPGNTIIWQGRTFKEYRGMGSLKSMTKGARDRYGHNDSGKFVPEGVEGRVPFKGSLSANIFQLMGGVRSGMGYVGARTLQELREKARFVRVTSGGLRESHPHDIVMTEETMNYPG